MPQQQLDLCARTGCGKHIGESCITLPEDGRDPGKRPEFCSTDCAAQERFRRKYDRRVSWDAL